MTTLPSYEAVANIQRVVAEAYGLDPKTLRRHSRKRKFVWPRQLAMFLTRERTDKSLPNIGRLFGGHDHSTVIYSIKAVEYRMNASRGYRDDVDAIRERLG